VTDIVKQQVAAHWNRRAPTFDDDFGHSIRTPAERAAWDRILGLVLPGRGALDALDVGCGTGFLSLELGARGHRVVGVDFAPAMIEAARRKATTGPVPVRFEQGDADQLPFLGGRSREQIATLLEGHGLVDVGSDPLLDLVEAQAQRMVDEGRERRTHRRYAVWGDVTRPRP
jgi:SAM-dependent methyltransferase